MVESFSKLFLIVAMSPPLLMGHPQSFLFRLPWRTWVCLSEDWVWRWQSFLDCRDPRDTKCTGKPAATDTGDLELLESCSRLWQLAFKGSPFLILLYCSVHQALKGPLSLRSLLVSCWPQHTGGERLQYDSTPCPWLSSSTLPPCFLVFF